MKNSKENTKRVGNKGFTLAELIVVLAISLIVVGITSSAFYSFRSSQSASKEGNLLKSLIEKARFETISEQSGSTYGVYFSSSSAVLFPGTSYLASNSSNQKLNFDSSLSLSTISLTGATTTVTFAALTGEPSATGTLVLSTKSSPSASTTVTITSSGIIE